ncbi:MAG: hypothetical protein AAF236_13260 [Verrucomicrobiota bacterium]
MKLFYFRRVLLPVALFALSPLAIAQDASIEEQAREILEQNKGALVIVSVSARLIATAAGEPLPENEQVRQATGVTVSDEGLVVISNSAIDPSAGLVGEQGRFDDEVVTIQTAKMEFDSIEISYGDRTTLKGKLVRQDVGADVAFILPDAEQAESINKTFSKVDLSQFASTVDVADRVVGLSRAPSFYGYLPMVAVGRINGVFKSDRTFYVTEVASSQGEPIFTLDGRPVGITVVRMIEGKPTGVLGTLSAGSIEVMANLVTSSLEEEAEAE